MRKQIDKYAYTCKLFNYPDNGEHLELINNTSFKITFGADENKKKNVWYCSNYKEIKCFKEVIDAYKYALESDIKSFESKAKLLKQIRDKL